MNDPDHVKLDEQSIQITTRSLNFVKRMVSLSLSLSQCKIYVYTTSCTYFWFCMRWFLSIQYQVYPFDLATKNYFLV